MSTKDTSAPAFPSSEWDAEYQRKFNTGGMTLCQYAAIKLKVPDSGTDWLDKMITKSLRDDFAARSMQGTMAEGIQAASDAERLGLSFTYAVARTAYAVADAMLEARDK